MQSAGYWHTCDQTDPWGRSSEQIWTRRKSTTYVLEHSRGNQKAVFAPYDLIIWYVDIKHHETVRFFFFDPSICNTCMSSNCRCSIFDPMSWLSLSYLRVLPLDSLFFIWTAPALITVCLVLNYSTTSVSSPLDYVSQEHRGHTFFCMFHEGLKN